MTIIELLYAAVKNGSDLSEAVEAIVPGADPIYWQRRLKGYNPDAPAKPKRKPAKRRQPATGKRKRSSAYAHRVATILATAELVRRVNEGDGDGS